LSCNGRPDILTKRVGEHATPNVSLEIHCQENQGSTATVALETRFSTLLSKEELLLGGIKNYVIEKTPVSGKPGV
jgi:hypothetical protein